MRTDKYEIDAAFRVYDNNDGVSIDVGESPDFPELVNIRTVGDKSVSYYGKIDLALSIEHAEYLVEAIQHQISFIKGKQGTLII